MRLSCAGLTITRDGVTRLGPLDLAIDLTGITCVLGHNGAGKSLFLRAVHGVIDADRGTIRWDAHAPMDTRRSRGFMFQTAPVMRRSVAQNIAFPLVAAGIAPDQRRAAVDTALASADLTPLAHQPAATLSGGERQRMALARALVTGPEVLIMDEPAANLDPAATKRLEHIVTETRAKGVAVIMSTHNIAQAKRLADHVLLFESGALAFTGPATEFFGVSNNQAVENFKNGYL